MCSALLLSGPNATAEASPSTASNISAAAIKSDGVFGSIEFETNSVSGAKKWQGVLERIEDEAALYDACDESRQACPHKVGAWRRSVRGLSTYKGWNLLAAVNSKINRLVKYRDDIDAYGRQDHWASPVEALTGEGDCEDYAILKYVSLLELGFADEQMRIVVVKDTRRDIGHAVLSVEMNGKTYILDSLRRAPVVHTKITRYVPHYSLNREGQWLNVAVRKRKTNVAERKTIKVKLSRPSERAATKLARAEGSALTAPADRPAPRDGVN